MKLSIERDAALEAVGRVQQVVKKTAKLEVLTFMRVEAFASGHAGFLGTDLDLQLETRCLAAVAEPGALLVKAELLHDLLRALPTGGEVELELTPDDPRLIVRCGRSRQRIPVMTFAELGIMPSPEGGAVEVDADLLRQMVTRTRFASGFADERHYLNGVYWSPATAPAGACWRAVGTDGKRAAVFEPAAPAGIDALPAVILPNRTADVLARLLNGRSGKATVRISKHGVAVKVGSTVLISKVLDGTFPDVDRFVPRTAPRSFKVETQGLAAAIRRAALMAHEAEDGRDVRLALTSGALAVHARAHDGAEAVEDLDAVYDGDPFEVRFRASYLLEMLDQVSAGSFELQFTDDSGPTLGLDADCPAVRFVVMPRPQRRAAQAAPA